MSNDPHNPTQRHLQPRYNLRKVCRVFNIHRNTLNSWIKDGVPLANGRRTRLPYVPLGPRKKEFECEQVERVYQELCASAAEEEGDVLSFPDEDERRQRAAMVSAGNGQRRRTS